MLMPVSYKHTKATEECVVDGANTARDDVKTVLHEYYRAEKDRLDRVFFVVSDEWALDEALERR